MTRTDLKPTRRDVLRQLALAVTAAGAGAFNLEAARVVHALAGEARAQPGGYRPQALDLHQFRTVTRLAELIVPADAGGGSGVDAGAPEFIDLLCSQNDRLLQIYTEGLTWIDDRMRDDHRATFVEADASRQTALLDRLVASERGDTPRGWRDGVRFFDWIRRMAVDAYYTSPTGIDDIGYRGNRALSAYETSADAIAFVERRADELGL